MHVPADVVKPRELPAASVNNSTSGPVVFLLTRISWACYLTQGGKCVVLQSRYKIMREDILVKK